MLIPPVVSENIPGQKSTGEEKEEELVFIVTGTVTDVPQTLPHVVSGVIFL